MARGIFGDELLSHQFHLIDVDWSLGIPPFVLLPQAGFSAITPPELSIDVDEISEGTSMFKHTVVKKGNVGNITLSKGATAFNSDFWRWTMACLKGTPTAKSISSFVVGAFSQKVPVAGKRRNMMLIQLSGVSPKGLVEAIKSKQGSPMDQLKAMSMMPFAGVGALAGLASGATSGVVDFGITSIPVKSWLLFNVLPVRYKAASDFDASTSAVSIQEIELSIERFEEFGLMA